MNWTMLGTRGAGRLAGMLAGLLFAAAALAQTVVIDLPAQPLGQALNALARQAGVRILFASGLAEGKTAPAVKGNMTPRAALERVLAGSGLEAQMKGDSFVVQPAAPARSEHELPEVKVRATVDGETATSPVPGYTATRSATATRTDTPLLETPQAIQVVPRVIIEDRSGGGAALNDVLGTVSSVTAFSRYQDFTFRGFRQNNSADTVTDGLRGSYFFHFNAPLSNIERVEVLKGPASVLYGADQPGGMMQLITKRPTDERLAELTVWGGSFSTYGAAVDVGSPFGPAVQVRVNASHDYTHTFQDFYYSRTSLIAPSITFKLAPATRLDLDYVYLQNKARNSFNRGIVAVNGDLHAVPITRNYSEPTDRAEAHSHSFTARLEHAVNPDLSLAVAVRRFSRKEDDLETTPVGITGSTVERRFSPFIDENYGYYFTAYGIKRFKTGAIAHRLLLGVDYMRRKRSYSYTEAFGAADGVPDIDAFNPVYGQVVNPVFSFAENYYQNERQPAVFIQDQIDLTPAWKLLLGVRHDRYKAESEDIYTGGRDLDTQSDSATTYRAGVLWLPRPGTSLYVNYAESFQPQVGSGVIFGGPFKPERGRQYEAGWKQEWRGGRLTSTVALFDVEKSEYLVCNPADGCLTSIQVGKARSTGIELDLAGRVTPNWQIIANWSSMDPRVTEDPNPGMVGTRLDNAPRHLGGLWTRYDFPGTGWGVGAGVKHVGGGREAFASGTSLPAYTVFNAALYWQPHKRVKLQLNVDNLADETYFVGSYGPHAVFPGAPRNAKLTAIFPL